MCCPLQSTASRRHADAAHGLRAAALQHACLVPSMACGARPGTPPQPPLHTPTHNRPPPLPCCTAAGEQLKDLGLEGSDGPLVLESVAALPPSLTKLMAVDSNMVEVPGGCKPAPGLQLRQLLGEPHCRSSSHPCWWHTPRAAVGHGRCTACAARPVQARRAQRGSSRRVQRAVYKAPARPVNAASPAACAKAGRARLPLQAPVRRVCRCPAEPLPPSHPTHPPRLPCSQQPPPPTPPAPPPPHTHPPSHTHPNTHTPPQPPPSPAEALSRTTALQSLYLSRNPLAPPSLSRLAALPRLELLSLIGCAFHSPPVELSALTSLRALVRAGTWPWAQLAGPRLPPAQPPAAPAGHWVCARACTAQQRVEHTAARRACGLLRGARAQQHALQRTGRPGATRAGAWPVCWGIE